MRNIFKKLDTLAPADRATALLSRWIAGGVLWLLIAICWPTFILWTILAAIVGGLGWGAMKLYRTVRDGMVRNMTRADRQAGRHFE